MASSGWQGNKDFPYSSSDLKCNLYITSITHTGTSLRVQGKVGAVCVNNSSGWYSWYDYPVYVKPEGGSQQTLLAANEKVYGDGQGGLSRAKTVDFDVTLTIGAADTSHSFGVYITMNNGQNTGTLHWNLTFPSSGTAPTGLNVTNVSTSERSVKATVSVTGWGGLGDSTTRYRELQVWQADMSGANRYQRATGDTLSGTITCSNSSQGTLDIIGNTKYWIGGYATNGTLASGPTSFGTAITAPPKLFGAPGTITQNSAVINWTMGNQGGELDIDVDYMVNNSGNWVTAETITTSGAKSGSFTVTGLSPNTAYTVSIRSKAVGGQTTSGQPIPFTTAGVGAKVYCSVNNTRKKVKRIYCSVNGERKKVKKIYCSVGGVAKLAYEDAA